MKENDLTDIFDGQMNAEEYFSQLIDEFPDLKNKLNEWEPDMIFFKMETFAEYTIEQIKSNNKLELKKCFDFQESKIDFIDSLLLNAVTVSYCEALILAENKQQIHILVNLMGSKLRKIYDDYERYYNDLGKNNIEN